MEHNRKSRRKLFGTISESLSELTGRISIIELFSDHELVISGCKSILEYDNSEVLIDSISGNVKVCGENLSLDSFQGDVLIIKGIISKVCLEDYD